MRKVIVVDENENEQTYALADAPSIISAFENAGYNYPHGCRVGVCGACASQVLKGIENLPPKNWTEEERIAAFRQEEALARENGNQNNDRLFAENVRLPCRTALTGDITLRPLSGRVVAFPKK